MKRFGQRGVGFSVVFGLVLIVCCHSPSLSTVSASQIVGWGQNTFGQINIPAGLTNATAISAGSDHALALLPNGTVVGRFKVGKSSFVNAINGEALAGVRAIFGEETQPRPALKWDMRARALDNFGQTNVPTHAAHQILSNSLLIRIDPNTRDRLTTMLPDTARSLMECAMRASKT